MIRFNSSFWIKYWLKDEPIDSSRQNKGRLTAQRKGIFLLIIPPGVLLRLFVALRTRFQAQNLDSHGCFSFSLDTSEAVSGSHVAHVVFVAPIVVQHGNARKSFNFMDYAT